MNQEKLSLGEDIKFHPHSFGDHELRLFQQDGELYRGIGATRADSFKELFDQGVIDQLVEQGLLIESVPLSFSQGSYEMVVHHRTVPFISYPNEWCAAMLKDAVLSMVILAIELAEYGYTLGDAHPWNLVFDIENCRPIFVDLGSIIQIYSPNWPVYDEFCHFCFYPLMLMSQGHDQTARLLMCEDSGVTKSYLLALLGESALSDLTLKSSWLSRADSILQKQIQRVPETYRIWAKKKLYSYLSTFNNKNNDLPLESVQGFRNNSHLDFLRQVKQDLDSIAIEKPDSQLTVVSSQYQNSESCQPIGKVLSNLRPRSVLALGRELVSNALCAANLGCRVLAFSTKQDIITQLYHYSKEHKLPILPLIMDFTKPTPARGLANHWSIPAHERLSCDLVLALGLVESIVETRRLNFEQIAEGFSLFSQRWLLVDFASSEDINIKKWWSERFHWYTLENFLKAIRNKFSTVNMVHSHGHRTLLLCEK